MNILNKKAILDGIKTDFIGRNIYYLHSTASTNLLAKENNQMPNGTLFIADTQTNGRGRLGREWASPDGEGIWMSLLLKPDIMPEKAPQITLIAGLALCKALGYGATIKYPNDIIINKRKVCGILTELGLSNNKVDYVVCGIGINVNTKHFPDELSDKATSLYIETNQKHNREDIISKAMLEFEGLYKEFLRNGLLTIIKDYRKYCININSMVKVILNNKEYIGKCTDIDTDGNIIVEINGVPTPISSGEVSIRGVLGYV